MSLSKTVKLLESQGYLLRVQHEVDPNGEISEIQRRAYAKKFPALLFENVKGTPFPVLSNLFGSMDQTKAIFGRALSRVEDAIALKANPADTFQKLLKKPQHYFHLPWTGIASSPKRIPKNKAPVCQNETSIDQLPQIIHWPEDGGAYITLPQVLTQHPNKPGIRHTNIGMYRVQISGGQYEQGQELGLHYQIHRGIGIHHQAALQMGKPLKVSIYVGGHPAHSVAAVMPLPEGLSELLMAGMLAQERFRYVEEDGYILSADADFCITGEILVDQLKPEGPFGDHLGYYSLAHDFPVMRVEKVYHRNGAIWPFTVVGRPPQEDTTFGKLIHQITQSMVPVSLPGVKNLHAVDAAGVHPLLLAIGSERYTPYLKQQPQEILTQANAILGFNQCSLAKYLWIAATEDDASLDIYDVPNFFKHMLERVDLTRDLHFQTCTTMDTLDYSGTALNQGSKLVIAAAGTPIRRLATEIPQGFSVPTDFGEPLLVMPGVLALKAPKYKDSAQAQTEMNTLSDALSKQENQGIVWIVSVDDSQFCAEDFANFLWVCFTRSNPANDTYGVKSFTHNKHWGCEGPLITDARIKPHHAPVLEVDEVITKRVDAICQNEAALRNLL